MPTKSIKTTTKSESKTSKSSSKKSSSKTSEKKITEKKNSTKKVVVKRRKTDLKPTKASAVAIVSQANRAKKKALIEKLSTEQRISNNSSSDNSKIPLWAWIFFWCSLLFFCISFYIAVFRKQIENDFINNQEISDVDWLNWNNLNSKDSLDNDNLVTNNTETFEWSGIPSQKEMIAPVTATETIQAFFDNLSNRNFDEAFDLMIPALRSASEIREHFTSFRMNPLLDWIEWWKLIPTNFQYIKSPTYWKDVYNFDLSYVMSSDQSKYDETREFTVNTQWAEPKISSIRCITPKCSYHPIFWPENFGLMR